MYHARLVKLWETVRASYGFVPTLMSLGAVGLSFVTIALDEALGAVGRRGGGDLFDHHRGRLGPQKASAQQVQKKR
jgi:hypothetical protein